MCMVLPMEGVEDHYLWLIHNTTGFAMDTYKMGTVFLQSKGNNPQSEETISEREGNSCKPYVS